MLEIPVIRWGKPYNSMEKAPVIHFETGEELAQMDQANGGLIKMDMRKAAKAREALLKFSIDELCEKAAVAGKLFMEAELPLGNGTQTPEDFCNIQSATTGLPVHMCAGNMKKNAFVMQHMKEVLDSLTRGLPFEILSQGYGMEDRGVMVSYQATSPVLGAVLPNNSPGVHTLWLPLIPLQLGLVLKPGSQEPWTPYRMFAAMVEAGIPAEAFCLYPGPRDCGAAVMETCDRSMIFGGQQTIDQYAHNPRVQPHGPGFSKILIGDDMVDQWEDYLDIIVDSIFANSGRSCINASSVWASRHTEEIADAIAQKLATVEPLPMSDPNASLAAFTTKGVAEAMNDQIEDKLKDNGVTEVTAKYREGDRWVAHDRYDFLRPTIVHCSSPEPFLANTEYMFPFASVVECPQAKMIKTIGTTLVGSVITEDETWSRELLQATNIDRLNIGRVKTMQLNWLQPHEGNIIDFMFRNRAFQNSPPPAH
ncbi:aldehyde dehydrogenase family protein [Planctomicrobium sp.]|jgi:acyl-CoA reductase-like NAD-dependent aldehyde dehydrogenase|nr:aldehyde dehydrogenase family protein [Planctomicrobium sp.]MBT5017714.1 aldehyde dehydrogenase [Planctomicrobium sp.]MDB4731899.1 aldehyde dehydrogenase family protein [bacterium]MDB4743793.1 aldehyde dehydrogenase family protein [Planctomicrobium sp.]